jgi:type IV pilus assembly protein PilQ
MITNETLKVAADKKYSGQLVSLNFDNIEIRNVLLLIAEVSDTNIIANDDVKGVITLRLNNVPWDQALDVIMESKGLAMEKEGNILRIAPKEVMLKRKLDNAKIETEISATIVKETKAFSVNYGPVDDIATKIKDQIKDNGTVSSDARTRQIFVTSTPDMLKEIEEQIIKRLDVADQQVTIEARIVEANSNFTRDLGVSWGISQQGTANGPWDLNGAMITGGGSFTINPGTQATNTTGPVFNNSAGIGSLFSFGRIGIDSTILDLRLSALEASGYGKIVSTPRITTSNGEAAEISQGTQIPYQTTSDAGTETKFIAATLALKVKPVINPDNSMILEIEVSNDSVGSTVAVGVGSAPSINTKKARTKVLVKNGETTVIGGLFIETETESEVGIPILRSIPVLGHLFKSTRKNKDKTELMIFITPRIVE